MVGEGVTGSSVGVGVGVSVGNGDGIRVGLRVGKCAGFPLGVGVEEGASGIGVLIGAIDTSAMAASLRDTVMSDARGRVVLVVDECM